MTTRTATEVELESEGFSVVVVDAGVRGALVEGKAGEGANDDAGVTGSSVVVCAAAIAWRHA